MVRAVSLVAVLTRPDPQLSPLTPILSWENASLFQATAARSNYVGMGRPDISHSAK